MRLIKFLLIMNVIAAINLDAAVPAARCSVPPVTAGLQRLYPTAWNAVARTGRVPTAQQSQSPATSSFTRQPIEIKPITTMPIRSTPSSVKQFRSDFVSNDETARNRGRNSRGGISRRYMLSTSDASIITPEKVKEAAADNITKNKNSLTNQFGDFLHSSASVELGDESRYELMKKIDNDYYVINYFLIHEMDPDKDMVKDFLSNWKKLKAETEEELLRIRKLMNKYSLVLRTKHSVAARLKNWAPSGWYHKELAGLRELYDKNAFLLSVLEMKQVVIQNMIGTEITSREAEELAYTLNTDK